MIIHGHVQGVFFRANTREKAKELGLTGWVKNLENGTVEVLAYGPQESLDSLLKWCHHGPAGASVSKVDYEWKKYEEEFSGFDIRYD